jgi:ATP-binding cassette subfamily C (CFTR/MRP) protein 1
MAKLDKIRYGRELPTLKNHGIALALANMFWNIGPFAVIFLSLVAFSLTQKTSLSPEIAFPALTLLNLLNNPLAGFPYTISAILNAADSIRRLSKFELESEIQPEAIHHAPIDAEGESAVIIEGASFTWSEPAETSLSVQNLIVNRRSLCCVVGSVGSGKSTLLQALLGSLFKSQGSVETYGSIAYAAQVPWILNGSIKDNILFGHELDPEFYDTVLDACALKDDLATLTNGDETQVGGKGMNLSGGQKARLGLARAIYARADIYLLDDVLSAVDMHVRRQLVLRVLGPQGMLRDTTRILATNTLSILEDSDLIVMLEKGKVIQMGSFENIRTEPGPIANFLQAHISLSDEEYDQTVPRNTATQISMPLSVVSNSVRPARLAGRQPRNAKAHMIRKQPPEKSSTPSVTAHPRESNHWKLYKTYAHASGFSGIFLFLLSLSAHRLTAEGADVWLKVWTEGEDTIDGSNDRWAYIGIYFALGLSSAILAAAQMYFLLVHCSLQV